MTAREGWAIRFDMNGSGYYAAECEHGMGYSATRPWMGKRFPDAMAAAKCLHEDYPYAERDGTASIVYVRGES